MTGDHPRRTPPCGPADEGARDRLVAEIEREVRETSGYLGKDRLDPRVLAAVGAVPREEFVPAELRELAYENAPLAIGHGQTISQPYIVAVMSDLLAPLPGDTVLEVGTGSGYQAAVLARLVRQVCSIEFVPELAASAADRLRRLGFANVEVRQGDGWHGWPERAPFDGIMVTAAAPRIPKALLAQLKPGRRLVIPVGPPGRPQELSVVEGGPPRRGEPRVVLPVAFVPLRGGR